MTDELQRLTALVEIVISSRSSDRYEQRLQPGFVSCQRSREDFLKKADIETFQEQPWSVLALQHNDRETVDSQITKRHLLSVFSNIQVSIR